jgi:hypothetical protein
VSEPTQTGEKVAVVKWCVTHDRRASGFVAAVCPNDPACVVMDLPAHYGTPTLDSKPEPVKGNTHMGGIHWSGRNDPTAPYAPRPDRNVP